MAGQDFVTQWEYTKEHCTDGDELALCNALGKEGWQAFHMESTTWRDRLQALNHGWRVYFKRELR